MPTAHIHVHSTCYEMCKDKCLTEVCAKKCWHPVGSARGSANVQLVGDYNLIIVIVDDFNQLQLWTLENLSILAAQSDIFPFYLPL